MKILFVGNSHTRANRLPFMMREMIWGGGAVTDLRVSMAAVNGMDLAWMAADEGTLLAMASDRWDVVVLQQQTHPFSGYERLASDYRLFAPRIKELGAKPVLFETWKLKTGPDSEQDILASAFCRLAAETGAGLVAVGSCWQEAIRRYPFLELYTGDGAHASPAGTYLAACLFARALAGLNPVGLPTRIVSEGEVLADLEPRHAEAIQRMAAEFPL